MARKRRVGECWSATAASDGVHQVFVSPCVDATGEAAAILVHELLHAALPDGTRHGAPFKRAMRPLGLVGKPTSTSAGPGLVKILEAFAAEIGPYPHVALAKDGARTGPTKQRTRMLKLTCPANDAHAQDCIVRTTRQVIDTIGLPSCACGRVFEPPDEPP
jgi:hypothetical protein